MASAADTLLDLAVDSFLAVLGGHGQCLLLLLGCLGGFLLLLLSLVGRRPALGEARALLAALVLALGTHLVGTVLGAAVVAGAVHTHTDGPFNPLDADGMGRR